MTRELVMDKSVDSNSIIFHMELKDNYYQDVKLPNKRNASQMQRSSGQEFNKPVMDMFGRDYEQDPQGYWNDVDDSYFRTIASHDVDKLDFLISQLYKPTKDPTPLERSESAGSINKEETSNPTYSILQKYQNTNEKLPNSHHNGKADIDAEIEDAINHQQVLHVENVQKLLELKDKSNNTDENQFSEESFYDFSPFVFQNETCDKNNQHGTFSKDSLKLQAEYLKTIIMKLEDTQTAESIRYVMDCRKIQYTKEYEFEVMFDEAISDKRAWISEEILEKLDRLRKTSVFELHNAPQKTYKSLQNLNAGSFIISMQKSIYRALEIPGKQWKEEMKKEIENRNSEPYRTFYQEKIMSEIQETGLCHHCKCVLPNQFLMKCGHKRQSKKAPKENLTPKKKKEDNKITCERKFCRACLKSHYNTRPRDILKSKNWSCPFCKGVCFCSRCVRAEQIKKYINLFEALGGSSGEITRSSSFVKLISKSANNTLMFDTKGFGSSKPLEKKPSQEKKNKKQRELPDSKYEPSTKKKQKVAKEAKASQASTELPQKSANFRKESNVLKDPQFYDCQEEVVPSFKKHLYRGAATAMQIESPEDDVINFNSIMLSPQNFFNYESTNLADEEIFLPNSPYEEKKDADRWSLGCFNFEEENFLLNIPDTTAAFDHIQDLEEEQKDKTKKGRNGPFKF